MASNIAFKCCGDDRVFTLPRKLLDGVSYVDDLLSCVVEDEDGNMETPFTYNQVEGFFTTIFLSGVDKEILETFKGQWHLYPQMVDFFHIKDSIMAARMDKIYSFIKVVLNRYPSHRDWREEYDAHKRNWCLRRGIGVDKFKWSIPDDIHVSIILEMIVDYTK